MNDKWTYIILFVGAIIFIMDFIVPPLKNKKENKIKEETVVTHPADPTPIKKEISKDLKFEERKEVKTVAKPKDMNKSKKQNVNTVKTTPVVKKEPTSTDMYKAFFNEHSNPNFYSDILLINEFKDINRKYFNDYVKVQSISFVDFNKIPGNYDKSLTYNGETHFIENKGLFIVISEDLKNDPIKLRSTIAHEMIHAYIDLKYIQGNPSELEKTFYKDQNLNHKGIFKEIEDSLNKRGLAINEDYVHVYDKSYLDKKLVRR